ncbi:MAG TPA: chemotaxis protein CheA [Vicinamibacterales bacterium]
MPLSDAQRRLAEQIDELLNGLAHDIVCGHTPVPALREQFSAVAQLLDQMEDPELTDLAALVRARNRGLDADLAPFLRQIVSEGWDAWVTRMGDETSSLRLLPAEQETPVVPLPPGSDPDPAGASAEVRIGLAPAPQPAAADDQDLAVLASDPEMAAMFVAEALDHLGTIESTVLALEAAPDDKQLLDDVFRPFHTIKGNAGALGVTSVQELAHNVENLLDLARAGRHHMGEVECEIVLKAVDLLTTMISELPARIAGAPATDTRAASARLIAEIDATINGRPVTDALAVAAAAQTTVQGAGGDARRRRGESAGATSVKVDTGKLDSLIDMVGELVIAQTLIFEDARLQSIVDERLQRNLAQVRRITSDLQHHAMAMRLVPIKPTFQKMARLVRDLSKRSGKPVELVLQGEETELDRKVIEEINDPLMHMIRNSIDHGIESVERRIAAGKRPEGRLTLSASHEGGNIVITISDDGGGLDNDRILAKAIERGLVPPDAVLSPAEIHQLIFKPGFSTAAEVTEISGRGVGMDVVRRNIEALRGRIEIQSTPGAGTTFSIKLPLTLAILDGLTLAVADQRFVLPTFSVRESLRPTPDQVHHVQGTPRMVQVRDQLMPLMWLADAFGITGARTDATQATVVVIEDDGRQIGLVVDELVGKQEVVIKALGDLFTRVRGVAGAAILGDGRVGLILDGGGLIDLLQGQPARAA